MDAKLKHIELIQGIINRMAANSFSLKGWSVVLVSAIFALAPASPDPRFSLLAYFPGVAFWVLDAYFLRQERLFRKLYDKVRVMPDSQVDFSMDTTPYHGEVASWFGTAFSVTLRIFHGMVIFVITVVAVLSLAA